MAPHLMIKVLSDIVRLVFYELFFIVNGTIIILKRFNPRIEFCVKFIFISIIRIIKNLVMPSVIKPYESKT